MVRTLWQDWLNFLLGLWLFLAPFFGVGALPPASWNSWIFGIVVMVLSGSAMLMPQRWQEWSNVLVGLWLIAAPFVLLFSQPQAFWNHIVLGVIIAIDALWATRSPVYRTAQ